MEVLKSGMDLLMDLPEWTYDNVYIVYFCIKWTYDFALKKGCFGYDVSFGVVYYNVLINIYRGIV